MINSCAPPSVPSLYVGRGGAAALCGQAPDLAHAQLDDAARRFTRAGLALADTRSRRWLERAGSPLLPEIAAVADMVGRPGAWLLNTSYEWGCTAAVAPDPPGVGMRLLRTLDWPFDGLGRGLIAATMDGPAGRWLNLTWSGFAGTLTALCPGRFAVAFNQTPMRARRLGRLALPMAADWALNRLAVARAPALPPAHLLRLVCDGARDYRDARRRLAETPLAASCLIALAGTGPGEGCVIERDETAARIHEAPVAVANDWLTPGRTGHPRSTHSREREAMMRASMNGPDAFAWLAPPILNRDTRLAAELNAAAGRALVQGWERAGPATAATVVRAAS